MFKALEIFISEISRIFEKNCLGKNYLRFQGGDIMTFIIFYLMEGFKIICFFKCFFIYTSVFLS